MASHFSQDEKRIKKQYKNTNMAKNMNRSKNFDCKNISNNFMEDKFSQVSINLKEDIESLKKLFTDKFNEVG